MNKNTILLLLAMMLGGAIYAQNDTLPAVDEFQFVDYEPQARNLAEVRDEIGYPQSAVDRNVEGTVLARVLVSTDGACIDHKIIKGIDTVLDSAVSANIDKLRFFPASLEGKPVPYWTNIPFSFRLVAQSPQESAITLLTEQLAANPNDYIALLQRGLQYKALRRYEESLADFDQSIALNPAQAGVEPVESDTETEAEEDSLQMPPAHYLFYALFARGTSQSATGKYAEASEDFNSAIQLGESIEDPDSSLLSTLPNVYMDRGYMFFIAKDFNKALADYQVARERSEELTCTVYQLEADLWLSTNDFANIVKAYDNLITCKPRDILLRYSRGFYKTEAGDFEGAVDDLEIVGENSANTNLRIAAYNRLAWAHMKAKKYAEGKAAIDKALTVNTLNAQSYYYRALIFLGEGNKEAACKDLLVSADYGLQGEELAEVEKLLAEHCPDVEQE